MREPFIVLTGGEEIGRKRYDGARHEIRCSVSEKFWSSSVSSSLPRTTVPADHPSNASNVCLHLLKQLQAIYILKEILKAADMSLS